MVEGTEHGRNRKTHGLKSKLEKLCGTSFFHLSSHDCEILCEAARALGVFCAFSIIRTVWLATGRFPAFRVVPLYLCLLPQGIPGALPRTALLKVLFVRLCGSFYRNQLLPLGHQVPGKVSDVLVFSQAVYRFPNSSLLQS